MTNDHYDSHTSSYRRRAGTILIALAVLAVVAALPAFDSNVWLAAAFVAFVCVPTGAAAMFVRRPVSASQLTATLLLLMPSIFGALRLADRFVLPVQRYGSRIAQWPTGYLVGAFVGPCCSFRCLY